MVTSELTLQDRADLIQLTNRYCRGIDNKDEQVLSMCLTQDLEAHHSMTGGLKGFDEFVRVINSIPPQVKMTQHYLTNHDVDGDQNEAVVRAYLFAQHAVETEQGIELMPGGGFYEFRCRNTEAGWRIRWLTNNVRWADPRLSDIFKPQ
jgi:hypothetical protein